MAQEMIKLIKSSFYKEDKTKEKLINFIRNADIFSMNKCCKKFEEDFSRKQGRKYSLFVSSGSAANLILIQAMRNKCLLKRGDKVAVSALTWATNVMPVIQHGLKPVAVDCEITTLNVSKKTLEEAYNKNKDIKCLFLTNALGFCSDIEKISKFCKEKKIIFLEDNCESLGTKINNNLLGNFGLASSFSFYVGHHLSTIEGGMICTDSKELWAEMCMIRAHGWDRNLDETSKMEIRAKFKINDFFSSYIFYDLAYNLRPTEINGFLGCVQLNFLDEIINKRFNNFNKIHDASKTNEDIRPLDVGHIDIISNFSFPLIFKNKGLAERYKMKFQNAGVEIRPIIAGNIQKQPFYKKYVSDATPCKNADFIHQNGFYFGNNPEMTDDELKLLCKLIKNE